METAGSFDGRMNLLVTIDRKYLPPLITMLRSYMQTHKGIKTHVFVAHASLTDEDLQHLERVVSGSDVQIHNVRVTDRYFSHTPILERLPEESFYRLLAFQYLPEQVDRCLYLDPDIYIQKSLMPLYTLDLGGAYLAAAGHLYGLTDALNKARLGCTGQERYINSGIMLMNLSAIRRDFTLEDVLACLEENAQRLILGDQDMVNILFGRKTVFLDERVYNLDERTFRHFSRKKQLDLDGVEQETAIIHYNGKYKPWNAGYRGVLNSFYPAVSELGAAPTGIWKRQLSSICRIIKPTRQQAFAASGCLLFLLLCGLSYGFFGKELVGLVSDPTAFRAWLDRFGVFDEAIFILIRAAQTVVKFIPAEPLEIGAGYAWGTLPGMLYCVTGNMIGTLIIFALTQKFGKRVIEFFIPVKNMRSLNLFKNSRHVYVLIFFLYLIPGAPKDGFTYLAGLLPVKPLPFLLVTLIARVPSVLFSALCGAALAEKDYSASLLILAATILLAVSGGLIYHAYCKKQPARPAKTPGV